LGERVGRRAARATRRCARNDRFVEQIRWEGDIALVVRQEVNQVVGEQFVVDVVQAHLTAGVVVLMVLLELGLLGLACQQMVKETNEIVLQGTLKKALKFLNKICNFFLIVKIKFFILKKFENGFFF
jgi:hypothetical protein